MSVSFIQKLAKTKGAWGPVRGYQRGLSPPVSSVLRPCQAGRTPATSAGTAYPPAGVTPCARRLRSHVHQDLSGLLPVVERLCEDVDGGVSPGELLRVLRRWQLGPVFEINF